MTERIIDIAGWQHPNGAPIDWGKVKAAGIVGVIVKATQGVGFVNGFYHGDIAGAKAAGLLTGAYHFADPATGTITEECDHFASVIGDEDLPLGVWYDLEKTGGKPWYELEQRCDAFHVRFDTPSRTAGNYLNKSYAGSLGNVPMALPLWLANPSRTAHSFHPWIEQHESGPLDGVQGGGVDFNDLLVHRGVNPNPAPVPAPAPPLGPDGEPEIRRGAQGDWVRTLQTLLNGHGANLAVDGDFGPATEAAVRAFQGVQGIGQDGIVGPVTWGRLDAAAPAPAPAPAPTPPPPTDLPTIEQGAVGGVVTALQRDLDRAGATLVVDGIFGPKTAAAVRAFQAAHGLDQDGIVGPKTWGALAG